MSPFTDHADSRFCCALRWGLVICGMVAAAATAADHPKPSTPPLALRIEWGGPTPRRWHGLVEFSAGTIEKIIPLSLQAEAPGSLHVDGRSVWIHRPRPQLLDGFDVHLRGGESARMSVTLQTAGSEPPQARFDLSLAELRHTPQTVALGNDGHRMTVRLSPGTELPIAFDRTHLILQPGEQFSCTLTGFPAHYNDSNRPPRPNVVRWHLSPARSERILTGRSVPLTNIDRRAAAIPLPLQLTMPEAEGAYDLHLEISGDDLFPARRIVQLMVMADNPESAADRQLPKNLSTLLFPLRESPGPLIGQSIDASAGLKVPARITHPRGALIDAFSPADPGSLRQVEHGRPSDQVPLPFTGPVTSFAFGDEPADTSGEAEHRLPVAWDAFHLHVRNPGRPHRLIAVLPGDVEQQVGISVLEPNAAGQLMPIGLDSGVTVRPLPPLLKVRTAVSVTSPVEHSILFWPKTDSPVLLLHDTGSGTAPQISRIELRELEPAAATTGSGHSADPLHQPQRLVGAYMHKPLLPENFGAAETLDEASGRSLDDWQTFHTAGSRLVHYLESSGYNSLVLAALADGSAIYPSRLLEPTPRYDTGIWSSVGRDPLRKDVLELLYRLFDRRGLMLIPELHFNTPLPELERLRRQEHGHGIELIGADGRSWRESRGTARGLAPYYNPLDPRVQTAILNVVGELTSRYHDHPGYRGIAIELSSDGFLQFPGLRWGYDDATIARFEKTTGIDVPGDNGPERFAVRDRFLTTTGRRAWQDWRSAELARFHHRLAELVAASAPGARLILTGNHILGKATPDDEVVRVITSGQSLESLLPPRGIELAAYQNKPGLHLLRPWLTSTTATDVSESITRVVNQSSTLERAYSQAGHGILFYHRPTELRIADFDAVSPWQPAFTWLAMHASPSGAAGRERYAHALATSDAHLLFDGGWMIPLGQEGATREYREIIRRLPAVDFALSRNQQQPAVVRIANVGNETFVYVVNLLDQPISGELTLSCPPQTAVRSLSGQRSELPLAQSPRGGRVPLRLDAFGVWAIVISDPAARIENIDVTVPPVVLTHLKRLIDGLDQRIGHLRQQATQQENLFRDPGFEGQNGMERADRWRIPEACQARIFVDDRNPHSGTAALTLTAGEDAPAVMQADVPVRGGRHAISSMWLRGSREQSKVTLAFDVEVSGTVRTQQVEVEVGPQWRHYRFQVRDIPPGTAGSGRLRITIPDSSQLWIDDIELRMLDISPDELRQLTKIYSAVHFAWNERRYADCQRLLKGYWGRVLVDGILRNPSSGNLRSAARHAGHRE